MHCQSYRRYSGQFLVEDAQNDVITSDGRPRNKQRHTCGNAKGIWPPMS